MQDGKYLLLGLQSTGKSTFLGALWYVSQCDEVETELTVAHLGALDDHLNGLQAAWLGFEEPARSAQGSQPLVGMHVKRKDGSSEGELYFPDLAGETFERQWLDRQCSLQFAEIAAECNGVLLFVHPYKVKEPERLEDYLEIMGQDNDEDQEPDPALPTSTVLVDLLQFIVDKPFYRTPLRVAVVISAWDLVGEGHVDGTTTPCGWLGNRLPLLAQFLEAHQNEIATEVYGVSAQGGDYGEQGAVERLAKLAPGERIQVLVDNRSTHDLTAPVAWLLSDH